MFLIRLNLILFLLVATLAPLRQRVNAQSANEENKTGAQSSKHAKDTGEARDDEDDLRGDRWRRKQDKIGVAFATNGISSGHRLYLALGGKGFLLGDGALRYGRENILEAYYTLHVWRGVFTPFDVQHINHPGYNRDRGPVLVPGLRLHLEF